MGKFEGVGGLTTLIKAWSPPTKENQNKMGFEKCILVTYSQTGSFSISVTTKVSQDTKIHLTVKWCLQT